LSAQLTPFEKATEYYKTSSNPRVETRIFLTSILGMPEQNVDEALNEIESNLGIFSPSPVASASERADEASTDARYNEYKSYLQAIFKPGDTLCFVTIEHNLDGDRKEELTRNTFAVFEDAITKESFLKILRANNTPSRNPRNSMPSIYVAMNTYPAILLGHPDRWQHNARTQANVVEVRALQADIDDAGNAATVVTAMQSSAKVPPPSIVVESSTGKRQGIWLVDGFSKDDAKPVMSAIAAEFGTDSSVAEIARVMRVPGFVNRKPKYTDQPMAKLLSNTGVRYTRDNFKFEASATADGFSKKPTDWLDDPFIHGRLDNQFVSVIGHYVNNKNINDAEELFTLMQARIEKNGCFEADGITPYAYNVDRLKELCQLKTKDWKTGEQQAKEAEAQALAQATEIGKAAAIAVTEAIADLEPPLKIEDEKYPEFPKYVWAGTSIYENFVKPICEHNNRIDYFLWLSSEAMLLNFLGTKIKTQIRGYNVSPFRGNIFMVIIGKRGETNKSSSVNDAMEYFKYIGCLAHSGRDAKTAEGRTLVFEAGSAEGLGVEMQKTNCTNALVFYDELEVLTNKAKIDGSTLRANLLKLYESAKFANLVKTGKEAYSLEPDSYCASLIANTTDDMFNDLWSTMSGEDTGLNDRFFFILQPKELPERRMKVGVDFLSNSSKTRQLIDKAINKGTFEIENINNPNLRQLMLMGNRYSERALKWALAIAVDLGLDSVDDEATDRGCDIVRYELAVKRYLKTRQADTPQAQLQHKIKEVLRRNKGRMLTRQLKIEAHAERKGTWMWTAAFMGLKQAGDVREEGTGKKGDPLYTVLIHDDAAGA
jgi:RepB DNA-primase N-terminal domain